MRAVIITLLVVVAAMAVGRTWGMLPPQIFKDPIFAAHDSSDDDGGSNSETTDFGCA